MVVFCHVLDFLRCDDLHSPPITSTPHSLGFVCIAKETEEAWEGEERNGSPPTTEGPPAKYTTTWHVGMRSLGPYQQKVTH